MMVALERRFQEEDNSFEEPLRCQDIVGVDMVVAIVCRSLF